MRGIILGMSTILSFYGWFFESNLNTLVNKLINNYSMEQRKSKNLILEGSGGAWPDDQLKLISLAFVKVGDYPIPLARRLIVSSINDLINQVNNNEKIIKYLKESKYTVSMMDLSISFRTVNNDIVTPPNVALVYLKNGMIYYRLWDNKKEKYYGENRETFDEAVLKVSEENNEIVLS